MKKLVMGAEAEINQIFFNNKKTILKKRIRKNYRNLKLDSLIRKQRTKREAKILKKLFGEINVPEVFLVDEKNCEILMEFIEGKIVKEIISEKIFLCKSVGEEIRKIHDLGIIHGDLTTSNIIFSDKKIFFIDFGLSFFSKKIEDKATDLILFKKTFNATHSKIKNGWEKILLGYSPDKEILNRMLKIEKRVRYL